MVSCHGRAGTGRVPSGARLAPRRWLPGVLVLGSLAGCGGSAVAPAPGNAALPELVALAPVTGIDGLSPRSRIAIDGEGSWLFAAPRLSQSALVLVEPDGRQQPIGGVGEGPGEARFAVPMRLVGDSVVGFDLATRRLIVWGRDGRFVESHEAGRDALPLLWPLGEHLLAMRSGPGGRIPVLVDPTSGESMAPISVDDSLYRALFAAGSSVSARPATAVLGTWRGGVVIGDGARFTFGLYQADGRLHTVIDRDLPDRHRSPAEVERLLTAARDAGMITGGEAGVAAERRRLAEEPVPWVSGPSHPRSDGDGRLWILRATDADSVVAAEIFADGIHLGTVALSCPGFAGEWALAADRLALVCAPLDEASPDDAELRRYRIVGAGGSGAR